VYIGGGTPSLLERAALESILDAIRKHLNCRWEEVTLEADPETITPDKAAAWRSAGVNRISLGVQSFHDNELRAAGRMHRHADIGAAFAALRAAAFDNISADLIIGLAHQTESSWRESLKELLALHPEHISIYLLEVDESSRLGREALSGGMRYGVTAIPDDDTQARCYEFARNLLAAASYEQYEISNWARVPRREINLLPERAGAESGPYRTNEDPFEESRILDARLFLRAPQTQHTRARVRDLRSQHNLKYWRREPYLGFGAGAHSFDGKTRWANAHDPAAYVAAMKTGVLPREQVETLTDEQSLEEELFLGLRLMEGIDVASLEQKYNVSLAQRLEPLRAAGWIEYDGVHARLAPDRVTVANEAFVELVS
jgi:oxygen-independent coproporphyrinogen-3 oxidase